MGRPPNKLPTESILAQVRGMIEAGEVMVGDDSLNRLERLEHNLRRDRKESQAWVIALLGDEPLPIKFFKPWACRHRMYEWERAGRITIHRFNRKLMIKASEFFTALKAMPKCSRLGKKE